MTEEELNKERTQIVERNINGIKFKYKQVYHLHYEVNENTGAVSKDKIVPIFSSDQVSRNLETVSRVYQATIRLKKL